MPNRLPRIPGFSYHGPYRYVVAFCTIRRQPSLAEPAVVEAVRAHFLRRAHIEGFVISAYCFMRDHVHLLVEGRRQDADLQLFVKMAKQESGYWYRQRTGRPLWQPGYFERVLRNEDETETAARYILANPVRAGYVATIVEWPFSGSEVFDISQW